MDKKTIEFGFNQIRYDVWLFQIAKLEYHNLTYLVCLLPVFDVNQILVQLSFLSLRSLTKLLGFGIVFPFLFHLNSFNRIH
jgi:hypothetical protein